MQNLAVNAKYAVNAKSGSECDFSCRRRQRLECVEAVKEAGLGGG
jgi:hypothetical protein